MPTTNRADNGPVFLWVYRLRTVSPGINSKEGLLIATVDTSMRAS